jgi:hypothetical protein
MKETMKWAVNIARMAETRNAHAFILVAVRT